ncbi:MAG: hypothetical protein ACLPKB_15330 [Xanthobacteraceae bacterium]
MKDGALKLLGGSLLITAGVTWVLNFPNLPALTGNAPGPTAASSTSGSHDIQQSYLACFFRSSLPISAGAPASGNYACPLDGKLNLVTFGAFGLLMLGAMVEGRRSGAKSPPARNEVARQAAARRPITPPKDYVKKQVLRRSTRKRRRW